MSLKKVLTLRVSVDWQLSKQLEETSALHSWYIITDMFNCVSLCYTGMILPCLSYRRVLLPMIRFSQLACHSMVLLLPTITPVMSQAGVVSIVRPAAKSANTQLMLGVAQPCVNQEYLIALGSAEMHQILLKFSAVITMSVSISFQLEVLRQLHYSRPYFLWWSTASAVKMTGGAAQRRQRWSAQEERASQHAM